MRRSLALVPVVAVVALTGCIIQPPAIAPPAPTVSTPPLPSTPASPDGADVADVPVADDDIGAVTPGGDTGSPGNPYPAGAGLTGGDWSVAISAADLEAEDEVVAGGALPAPEGWRWIATDVRVSTTATGSSSEDVWASYVTPAGEVYFSVIDADIPGTNPFREMAADEELTFREYLLAPEATLEQGVLSITTDGLTSFVALR